MKLVHQINLAFGLMMLVVMSAAAVIIHYVLLDHLIGVQQKDMKSISESISATYPLSSVMQTVEAGQAYPPESGSLQPVQGTVPQMVVGSYAGIQAIVSDSSGQIVSVNKAEPGEPVAFGRGELIALEKATAMDSIAVREAAAIQGAAATYVWPPMFAAKTWNGTVDGYIVDVRPLPEGTLTLLSPISKIREVERAMMVRLLPVFGGGVILVLLLSLLITRKLIKPLLRLKEELEKVKERRFAEVREVRAKGEIGAVARTVHDMAAELHRNAEAQRQFFQNASHELKTPLMSISGYAEGIRDGVFEGEGVRRGLDIIMSESARLKKLVSEMTLLAKLDSEEDIYHYSSVSLMELLSETMERLDPVLTGKGIVARIECGSQEEARVHADRDKLLQALLNVVSNAARYARSRITVRLAAQDGRAVIRVEDDGAGISEELLPHLFHRFVKGKDGESGLGLAISRAIVERCGGKIAADNRPEGGAVVSLELPAAA